MVEPEKRWAELGLLAGRRRAAGRAGPAPRPRLFADWVLRELPVNRLFARTRPDNPGAGARGRAAPGSTEAGALDTGTTVWVRDRARSADRRRLGAVGLVPSPLTVKRVL